MTRKQLFENIKKKKSFLCVGLDTDITKLPKHLLKTDDPIYEFNKKIIEATKDLCVSYKLNTAFYESIGAKGWLSMERTANYIDIYCKDIFTIADAKRGDIGNTSKMYARAFFDLMNFDAITIAPYMGEDSVMPFMDHKGKWVILLALTSNKGSEDFQSTLMVPPAFQNRRGDYMRQLAKLGTSNESISRGMMFEQVIKTSKNWGTADNMMYVVGATKAEMLGEIRKLIPDSFLLVPGVGAQGGSLEDVAKFGMNKNCGLLVNSSRQIIFASSGEDFAEKARAEALKVQREMEDLLEQYLL